jgi:hypothetical protein
MNQTTGKWTENKKVYCQFNNRDGGILQVQQQQDSGENNNNFNYCSRMEPYKFGPELGFGWLMSSNKYSNINTNNPSDDDDIDIYIDNNDDIYIDNNDDTDTETSTTPILILKQAWDSSDLAVDFRPPSSGKANYKHSKQYESVYYNAMMNNLKWTIDSLKSNTVSDENKNEEEDNNNNNGNGSYLQSAIYMKSNNTNQQYYWSPKDRILYDTVHISGFLWFQGWNDYIYDDMSLEYEYNLANFIRDIRNELNISNLPFVIGELGQRGGNISTDIDDTDNSSNNIDNRTLVMRQSQYNIVTQYPEFYNNTMFVETSKYYFEDDKEKGLYDGIEHYYGRADTIYKIGKDFGKAMIQLEKQQREQNNIT